MEEVLDQPGPIELDTVVSAEWRVPLGGLLNLDSPVAQSNRLEDRSEPIQIYVHILKHPTRGGFLIDTGVSEKVLNEPADFGIHWLMHRLAGFDQLRLQRSAEDISAKLGTGLRGVFFTHLHIDHIAGVPAMASSVPFYIGRREGSAPTFKNLFVRGVTDTLFEGKAPLREWPQAGEANEPLSSVIDIFGDGTLYALNVPGHTAGSTAYVARTPKGPVLLTGDACHTRWGWEHSVEPGSFTADQALNRRSLLALKELTARHPSLEIRLGHQPMNPIPAAP